MGMSDEECEATVVAENIPEVPPALSKPAAPAGTPLVHSLVTCSEGCIPRNKFKPCKFSKSTFHSRRYAGEEETPIGAMPECYRLGWRHGLVEEARDVGVNSIVLFSKVPDALKSCTGDEAYNENRLVPRTIRLLKDKYPDLVIYIDVALDPYSSDGHDGIVREDGVIMNDENVHQLCKQAVTQARAGADVARPSDIMDGRIREIRAALDADGFQYVSIASYTAREALVETREDESEGADILLVKPGLPYLDIIRLLRDNSHLPIAAYQVSGEYSMIKADGVLKMIDEERVMMESRMCLRRDGANIIISYFALQAARCLCGEKR
ncbi:Delta-aminolevulinic acid dehydratase 1 [Forsythia ovata]|uniref:Delta-aminolevulinic acid dehydratase n=1 Tax=Forsythia ovata TaxID=205694 RepID=A0ABD1U5S6_9LAMI